MGKSCHLFTAFLITLSLQAGAQDVDPLHGNLRRVPDAKLDAAYLDPDAELGRYQGILVLEPLVAFRKHWQRDHRGVSSSDMERIKRSLANLFMDEFEDVLREGGINVVGAPAEDVLVVRPALIDLDVSAPDVMTAGRSRTFVANAGAVTLYVELVDSVTGAVLARAVDRKAGRERGRFTMASSVYNTSEARNAIRQWAELLRDRFNTLRGIVPAASGNP